MSATVLPFPPGRIVRRTEAPRPKAKVRRPLPERAPAPRSDHGERLAELAAKRAMRLLVDALRSGRFNEVADPMIARIRELQELAPRKGLSEERLQDLAARLAAAWPDPGKPAT